VFCYFFWIKRISEINLKIICRNRWGGWPASKNTVVGWVGFYINPASFVQRVIFWPAPKKWCVATNCFYSSVRSRGWNTYPRRVRHKRAHVPVVGEEPRAGRRHQRTREQAVELVAWSVMPVQCDRVIIFLKKTNTSKSRLARQSHNDLFASFVFYWIFNTKR